MFKVVRNIIILIAFVAAGIATYVTLFPSTPHAVAVHNRSGRAASDVRITVEDLSGQAVGSAQSPSLPDGQSLSVRHALKTAQMFLSFKLDGQPHEHTNPYLDYSSGTSWTFEIQPDGGIKVAPPGS